jgi:hypothetical protein
VVAVSGDVRNVLCTIIASNKLREADLLEAQAAQPKPFAIRDGIAMRIKCWLLPKQFSLMQITEIFSA